MWVDNGSHDKENEEDDGVDDKDVGIVVERSFDNSIPLEDVIDKNTKKQLLHFLLSRRCHRLRMLISLASTTEIVFHPLLRIGRRCSCSVNSSLDG